jgi:Mce-associated membrane protein
MTHATRTASSAARRPSPRPRTTQPTEEDGPENTVQTEIGEDSEAEAPAADEGEQDEQPAPRAPRSRRWRWTFLILGVVVVLLLCLTGWLFWQNRDTKQADADRDNVVLAARQGVLNLTGLGHVDAEGSYARLLQGSTGDFRNQLAQQADSFKQALAQGQVNSTGQISEAGLEQLNGDTATALVVASANVKNTQAPQGENRQYRLRLTLQRQGDGQWLISELEFVA